jgi:F-type H+-transporting ATPase subunit epsilon
VGELQASAAQQRLADASAAFDSVDKLDVAALDAAMDKLQSARAMVEAAGG